MSRIGILFALLLPAKAYPVWQTEILSDRRVAAIFEHPDDGLEIFERGGKHDGGRQFHRDNADRLIEIKSTTLNRAKSGVYSLKHSSAPEQAGPVVNAVGLQGGILRCAHPWYILQDDANHVIAIDHQRHASQQLMLRRVAGYFWPGFRKAFELRPGAFILSDSAQATSYLFSCAGDAVESKELFAVRGGTKLGVVLMEKADSTSDVLWGAIGNTVVEGRLAANSGEFEVKREVQIPAVGEIMGIARGPGRQDGIPRIYVAGNRGLVELEWADGRPNIIPISRSGDRFRERTTGPIIGAVRGDGVYRVYAANGETLFEYTHAHGAWAETSSLALDQRIFELRSVRLRDAERLIVLGEDHDALLMKWREGGWVVVAPFLGGAAPTPESQYISDALRLRLVGLQNCKVLEREGFISLLKEHSIQASQLVDRNAAVKFGKLIGADHVVVGRVQKLFGKYLVSAKAVDVQNGVISRHVIGEASSLKELKGQLSDTSLGLCSGRLH